MIDRRTLPKGHYTEDGFETRQVFDIDISRVVTEYQAQRLINEQGKCFVAPFPKKVSKAVQYGDGIKAHAIYLSQYQLLAYKNISPTNCRCPSAKAHCITSIYRLMST